MSAALRRIRPRTAILAGILLVLGLAWLCFHRQLSGLLAAHLLLSSNNPRDEFFEEVSRQSADPVDFLNRSWATGKITHRQLVSAFLRSSAVTNAEWFARAEPLVLAGTADADMSVRESALAVLETRRSPRLFEKARAQLGDIDPMLRLLGLDYLRKTDPQLAVPAVVTMLDDPDLRVVAHAEVALMRWSGADFGVRMHMAVPAQGGGDPAGIDRANAEAIRRGAEQRKQWWQTHAQDYQARPVVPATDDSLPPKWWTVPDFRLQNLSGGTVRLSDLRGKVVLLNFWASWCPACLAEIPELISLQNKLGDQIAIVGIALDGVPDEEGDVPGDERGRQPGAGALSLKAIRETVGRAVKRHSINYTVLLDPGNSTGSLFNGGELPTTVILDKAGRVRRRFIGERSLKVFEAMVAEAGGASVTAPL